MHTDDTQAAAPKRKPTKAEVDAALISGRKNNAIEGVLITDEEFARARVTAHLKHRGVAPDAADATGSE